MQIILLTHERELTRPSNTGQLALAAFPDKVQRVTWSRVHADTALIAALASQQAILLFPKEDAKMSVASAENQAEYNLDPTVDAIAKTVVILDATWQEARKMFRQSPYLKTAARLALNESRSQFALRRNQITDGLCTVECIIALWQQVGWTHAAAQLSSAFLQMNAGKKSV